MSWGEKQFDSTVLNKVVIRWRIVTDGIKDKKFQSRFLQNDQSICCFTWSQKEILSFALPGETNNKFEI